MTETLAPRWELRITGTPRTKKNSRRADRRGRIRLPSRPWEKWVRSCWVQMIHSDEPWPAHWQTIGWLHMPAKELPALIDEKQRDSADGRGREDRPAKLRLNCCASIYRDADRGDANGFYQGIADLLEKLKVISNDRMIVSWHGSELYKDAALPRVELTLTVKPPSLQPKGSV
jgi:hypothetical protein